MSTQPGVVQKEGYAGQWLDWGFYSDEFFSAPDCVLCPPPIKLPGENTAAALELFRALQD